MEAADETTFSKYIGTERGKATGAMEKEARTIRHHRKAPLEAAGAVEKKGAFYEGRGHSEKDVDGVVAG
jgi:hypothetical protein